MGGDLLFQDGAPKLWTVPAGAPFIEALARAMADATGLQSRPEALADALVYVPNRRSARALALSLHRAAGDRTAVLMPQIRALGDLETDDAPPGVDAAFADLGPALPEARRLGTLMKLVMAWFEARGTSLPPGAALSTARELASLLDAAAIAGGADWSALPDLVENADLAMHWKESVEFLSIITEAWPAWLAENNAMDPLSRRLAAAQTIAETWSGTPPAGPVIIAGSTGATPASRILMQAALTLPRSAVILPGVDGALTQEDSEIIADEPGHPQHALVRTLSQLGAEPAAIPVLPGLEPVSHEQRRALIHESLSPAALTGDWRQRLNALSGSDNLEAFTLSALDGLDVVQCRDEMEEAMAAACLLRATLETHGRTAALVCPDAGLARRVSAHLARWDLDVTPSEGTPLLHTPAGASLDALMAWWCEPADPVAMATLLRAPHGRSLGGAETFERWVLRGVRWWDDLPGLVAGLEARLGDERLHHRPSQEALAQVRSVAIHLERLAAVFDGAGKRTSAEFRERLSKALSQALETDRLWRGSGGAALARLIETLDLIAEPIGALDAADWLALTRTLAAETNVPPDTPGHPRLSIWGPLEARLQSADHLILAGLNESVWPRRPGADTFLPRKLRAKLGLEDPETLMGLAAHDFAGLACAPRVTLMYTARRDDAPAVASRWVWRLETLVRGALGERSKQALAPAPESDPRRWVDALKEPLREQPNDHAVPAPRPPVAARPDRLSVTRIDVLQRDPYAIYAEQVLGLSPLDPLGKPIDARETGTAVHRALELFDAEPAMGPEGLLTLLETELRWHGEARESLVGRRVILRGIAEWYVVWHSARQAGLEGSAFLEVRGTLSVPRPGLPDFTLSAVADRIERRVGSGLAILDFKTGGPPSDKEIGAGLSQQMPLQALIAAEGGFPDVPARPVDELTYVAVKARPDIRNIGTGRDLKASPTELAEAARDGLARLLAAYGNPGRPYLSAPRAQFVKYEGDYGRLARRAEWTSEIGNE